jgi:hypothetical protein
MGVIISITLFVLSLIFGNRQKMPVSLVPPRAPKVINFMSKFTNGHGTGMEISFEKGKSGRYICKYLPDDLDETFDDDRSVISEPLKVQTIVVKDRLVIPSGHLSKRDVVFYLPNNSTELDPIIKKNWVGGLLDKQINATTLLDNISISIQERDKIQKDMIEKYAGGEYSRDFIEKVLRFDKMLMEATLMKQIGAQENK